MTTTANGGESYFSFSGSTHLGPLDQIDECGDALDFLASTLGRGDVDLQLRAPTGLVWIINGIRQTLDSACERLKVEVNEPYNRGYSDGSKLAPAEYKRGYDLGYRLGKDVARWREFIDGIKASGKSIDDVLVLLGKGEASPDAAEPGGRAADDPAA